MASGDLECGNISADSISAGGFRSVSYALRTHQLLTAFLFLCLMFPFLSSSTSSPSWSSTHLQSWPTSSSGRLPTRLPMRMLVHLHSWIKSSAFAVRRNRPALRRWFPALITVSAAMDLALIILIWITTAASNQVTSKSGMGACGGAGLHFEAECVWWNLMNTSEIDNRWEPNANLRRRDAHDVGFSTSQLGGQILWCIFKIEIRISYWVVLFQ